jgi:hypothetical protein
MFDLIMHLFRSGGQTPTDHLVRLGSASPVGFALPANLNHAAVSDSESVFRLKDNGQPIQLRMTFLNDYSQDLTTPELERECLSRIGREAEVFQFGRNQAIGESAEIQDERGLVIHMHHTISVQGLICTATLEILRDRVSSASVQMFRDALMELFQSMKRIDPLS